MIEELSKAVELGGNNMMAASSLFLAVFTGMALYRNYKFKEMSKEATQFTLGFFIRNLGEFVRLFWWTPAILFAYGVDEHGHPDLYHDWFENNRIWMYLVAVPLFIAGAGIYLKELSGSNRWVKAYYATAISFGILAVILDYWI